MAVAKAAKDKAVIYCRVSTKEQESNCSLGSQEIACRDFCAKNNWGVVQVFSEAHSAKTVNRTQFQVMLEFCGLHHKSIAAVVVYDGTRFSRETMDALSVEAILNAKGIVVRSATQPFDESPAGALMKTIVYAYATFDNKLKAQKTVQGMKASINKGLWVHKAPLGYRNVTRVSTDAANIEPDPQRAPLIQQAFELYATGRYTKIQVLKRVTEMGLLNLAGIPLTPQFFDKMLRKPVYKGWIVSTWGLEAQGRFDAIVSPEIFARVQAVRAGKASAVVERGLRKKEFPLSPFLRCGVCGTPLAGSTSTGRGGKYSYYFCREKTCRAVSLRRDLLHVDFVGFMETFKLRESFWPLFEAVLADVWRTKHLQHKTSVELIGQQRAKLNAHKDKLIRALLDDKLKQHHYDEQMERVEHTLSKLNEKQLVELQTEKELADLVIFAKWILDTAGPLWYAAQHDKKLRIQAAFFPEGLSISKEGFGTPSSLSFLKQLDANTTDQISLASPEGFEPSLPP
jgi:site-specific DNA recombinase